ncbi:hydroxyglutarate oxidase [Streptomyces abyssalis]|uniref:Hydroxyglutarate oxidase n=1 Tax=Streptomyces abyssalis TaxID=933944 RepID=A0A1E7JP30_9ACTN|nr:L-2-hydroxyglutarate oxidase [Streptomyces abyssalis]OEU87448.1 hydroxyglutarate oxidase [Streptomyces abyssalis]OEU90016.1 hydroxyglutarate oxidase [Streptomyces abyssalis]
MQEPAPATPGSSRGARPRPGYDCDVVIVGGGIVGLSTAYAITRAAPGTRVVVLEKEPGPARHQTGRNSGVIHSGIYYRPGSLKARFAVRGAAEMTAFCAEYGIPHEVTGKLIVATDREELPRLHALIQRGRQHGIPVRELGPAQIAAREPHVRGLAAIDVGTTGVCDFGAVAGQLARLAQEGGAEIRYGSQVTAVRRRAGTGVAVRVSEEDATPAGSSPAGSLAPGHSPPGSSVVRARAMVNCAGLHCARVAQLTGDEPAARIVPFRGEYFELTRAREDLVRGLVYPVPDPAFPFLGVHLTRGVDGGVHIGPNAVPALALEGYDWRTVRPSELAAVLAHPGTWRMARRHWRYGVGELHRSLSKRAFTEAVRRLLPEVSEGDLVPAPAGVRAQAVLHDGTLVDDFLITEGPHAVHVLNAPSPAATASLPIGREVASRALSALNALEPAAR